MSSDHCTDVDSRPYFEGLSKGEILLQWCSACERHQFPPRAFCVRCGRRPLVWRAAFGRGRLYAVTVVHRPSEEAFTHLIPYAVGLVDLDERVRVMARGDVPAGDVGTSVVVAPDPAPPLSPSLLFRSDGAEIAR